jgi:hypothetical protein
MFMSVFEDTKFDIMYVSFKKRESNQWAFLEYIDILHNAHGLSPIGNICVTYRHFTVTALTKSFFFDSITYPLYFPLRGWGLVKDAQY